MEWQAGRVLQYGMQERKHGTSSWRATTRRWIPVLKAGLWEAQLEGFARKLLQPAVPEHRPTNLHADGLWQADVERLARRLL